MKIRNVARHGILSAGGRLSAATGNPLIATPTLKWIYFHSLPPGSDGHLDRLLGLLCETHNFLSYSDAVDFAKTGTQPSEPSFCLSIDDGFESSYRAAKLAEQHGGSTCLFVPTSGVGLNGKSEVSQFFGSHEGIEPRTLTWRELEALRSDGHEIGSHTMTHLDLSKLSSEDLLEELSKAKEMLEDRVDGGRHFAWPFGRWFHVSSQAIRIAFTIGHASVASAERGSEPLSTQHGPILRRDHISPEWPFWHALAFLSITARRPAPSQPHWETS